MAEFIVMPKLGFDMREGVLNNWLKAVGDTVTRGEVVAEIESDKATLDLESQSDGVLLEILQDPGAIVPVGANMAIVGSEGEDYSDLMAQVDGGAPAEEAADTSAETPAEAADAPAAETKAAPANVSAEFPGGVKSTPVARRMAAEHDVDLTQVNGSGPDGRVRKADVEAYLANPPAAQPTAAAPAATPVQTSPVRIDDSAEVIETSRVRQAIARRMVESKTTVPHFYVTSAIDMAPVLQLRKEINATLAEDGIKVSVNDLIVKAAALALRDFPNLNAAFNGDTIVRYNEINVGTAVAVEGGLLTVVQKNTDVSTLSKIATDHKEMIARARSGKIKPEDVERGTFTVSNLGGFDVDNFIAIVNPPDAAILAVGSAKPTPVVKDGEIVVGNIMKATISADHRVTDGAEAAQYMQALKSLLENPMRLLV